MQHVDSILFLFIGAITILTVVGLLVSRNAIYSVLGLAATIIFMASLMILAGSDFLGISMIIIYVGAVAVLFLFVVMMTKNESEGLKAFNIKRLAKVLFVTGLTSTILLWLTDNDDYYMQTVHSPTAIQNNLESIGFSLYSEYALHLQVVAMILLAAMLGSVMLIVYHTDEKKTRYAKTAGAISLHNIKSGAAAQILNNKS